MNQMKGMMMNMLVNYNNDNNQISAVRNDSCECEEHIQ